MVRDTGICSCRSSLARRHAISQRLPRLTEHVPWVLRGPPEAVPQEPVDPGEVVDLGDDLAPLPVEHREGINPDPGGNLPLEEAQQTPASTEVFAKGLGVPGKCRIRRFLRT